jgi:Glycosyl hydrolase family 76
MILGLDHRHALGALCAMTLLWAAPAAQAASSARAPADPSHYPAAATRAAFHPRRSEFAHASAAKSKAKKPKKPKLRGNPARALAAFEAMQTRYYLLGSGLYAGEPFSFLWPFSQALAATVSLANVPHLGVSMARDLKAREVGLRSYLDANNSGAAEGTFTSTLAAFDGTVAPPSGPGGTKYYDDNDWVGIELVRLYKLTHEPSVRESAEAIMAFEMAGWQTNPELGCPGGIPFDNAANNTDRNTVTTAPAAELALQLYKLTHNSQYLTFAEMAYQWVRSCLLQPSELYADHVNPKGVVEGSLWSYNQGTMIGAGTMLYQATGNSGFLYQARQTARAAVVYFTPERLAGENPFFPSVYFRNLMYLDSITHDPPGKAPAQNYVNYAWQFRRLSDNVFVAGTPPSAQLLYQAAVAQIYALLSSPASTYF